MSISFPINLLEIILQAWKKTTESEYQRMKDIWWIERDLIDTFYRFLNPVLDLVPQYDLFSEWYVKLTQEKSGNAKVDLAIVEPNISRKEAYLRIPMEFKWTVLSGLSKTRIKQDAENLTKMSLKGCLDSDRGDVVCRGVKVEHAFLFIFYDDVEVQEAVEFFKQIRTDYPAVDVQWACPNE